MNITDSGNPKLETHSCQPSLIITRRQDTEFRTCFCHQRLSILEYSGVSPASLIVWCHHLQKLNGVLMLLFLQHTFLQVDKNLRN